MTGISSSVGSATTLASIISLDTDGDGTASAAEPDTGTANQRNHELTVESDNGASGIAAQLISEMMAALLNKAQAGQFDNQDTGLLNEAWFEAATGASRADAPAPSQTEADASGYTAADESDSTMSLTDLLDRMTSIINSYRQFSADRESEPNTSTHI